MMQSEDPNGAGLHSVSTRKHLSPEITEEMVQQQLQRIRSSSQFRSSRRCLVFLDYVVRAAANGHLDSLKERTIGIEVFGRTPNYDTNQDPVVRGTASEVRKRLAQYYQTAGNERQLKIHLAAGSYLPEFRLPSTSAAVSGNLALKPEVLLPPGAEALSSNIKPLPFRRGRTWVAASAIVVFIVLAAAVLVTRGTSPKALALLDQFWNPILDSPAPVLLCVGQPTVFNLLGSFHVEVMKRFAASERGNETRPTHDERMTANLSDIVPNSDRYLALGDAMCLADFAAFFARKGHAYHIRGGGSTSFADLRESPSILIGAFTNDWNMRLMGELRFTFERDPDGTFPHVQDRRNPSNRHWGLTHEWPDWKMPVDYAIVSRVSDITSGKAVVTAAGITQYGTAAAGEFLTNPEYLAQALRQAPHDWQHKNMQVVLMTRVIGGTAGSPQVLATQFW